MCEFYELLIKLVLIVFAVGLLRLIKVVASGEWKDYGEIDPTLSDSTIKMAAKIVVVSAFFMVLVIISIVFT